MQGEVVDGFLDGQTCNQHAHVLGKQGLLQSLRLVEVVVGSLGEFQVRQIPIVGIQAQYRCVQSLRQTTGQLALARAGRPGDAYEARAHTAMIG